MTLWNKTEPLLRAGEVVFESSETKAQLIQIFESVQVVQPQVHCITNYVTAGDCANALLAVGASPVMADAPEEAADIAAKADAVVLNLGTLSSSKLKAMVAAGKTANHFNRPVILDPVGAGASSWRNNSAGKLLEALQVSVIRGNVSEIIALEGSKSAARGVDASVLDQPDTLEKLMRVAQRLAQRTGAVVVMSGAVDVATDGKTTCILQNGHPSMGRITGTGCMLSATTAAYVAASPEAVLEAAACATAVMGMAGELAAQKAKAAGLGTGSLRVFLMDALSMIDVKTFETMLRLQKAAGKGGRYL